jgi:hypothetical protein
VLDARDLHVLMEREPRIAEHIREVARTRLGGVHAKAILWSKSSKRQRRSSARRVITAARDAELSATTCNRPGLP